MEIFVCDVSNIDNDRLKKAADVLSQTEKKRLQNMISVKRQREFILGHFFLRKAVAVYTQKSFAEIEVESLDSGALFLPKMSDVFASLSHSKNYILIGLAHQPIGVDVEWVRFKESLPQLLAQIDGVSSALLLQKSGFLSTDSFFQTWGRREACYKLKSFGNGIAFEHPFFYCQKIQDFMFCAATPLPEKNILHLAFEKE